MSNLISKQAELAAARVDGQVASALGGIAVITEILTQVFSFLIACKNRETPDPSEVQAAVGEEHRWNPKALRRRTARRIRFSADASMTKPQSFALAGASIEQILSADEATVKECCMAVPSDLVVEDES